MRIGVDCRLSGKAHSGIGRYIEELITRLAQNEGHSWVFFFSTQKQVNDCFTEEIPSNVKIILTPTRHYTIREQLFLPLVYYHQDLDLLHIPHFNAPIFYFKKKIVTIHDLLWHEHKGTSITTLNPIIYWPKYLFYRLITTITVFSAWKILVPSQTIKSTLLQHYPSAKNKVHVTLEGYFKSDELQSSNEKRLVKLHELSKPYLLYVGSLYPHKNLKIVVESLSKITDANLYIVGSRSVFQKQIKKFIKSNLVESQVKFLGFLNDSELSVVYKNATALVQPSLSEGFGLTGIEAMSMTVPLLASNIPIFKEIYGEYPVYFDPYSSQSFIQAYNKLAKLKRSELRSKAEVVLKKYDWNKMAKETISQYETP